VTRGQFISFEGGEGAGKSTQVARLVARLEPLLEGRKVVRTREPGGSKGAEAIRNLVVATEAEPWSAMTETLLMYASRSDHLERTIRPALEAGDWVVCDRFADSSRAYQGGAGGLGDDAILGLHDFGSGGLRPDLVILLEGDEAVLAARLAARDGDASDAIGGRPADYHRAVAAAFRALAERAPKGFARIDAIGDTLAVHHRVLAAVAPLIESPRA